MTHGTHTTSVSRPSSTWHGSARPLRTVVALMRARVDRHRQRRALADLDPRLLRDIGVTHFQVEQEIAKRFWRC